MKIKYFENGKTTIARGFKDTYGPEGVPDEVFFMVLSSNSLTSQEHETLMSSSDFTSVSAPHGDDSYDKKIGHDVARDKTVIKNCNREQKQLEIIRNELEKQLNNVVSRISICNKKKANAESRLSSY